MAMVSAFASAMLAATPVAAMSAVPAQSATATASCVVFAVRTGDTGAAVSVVQSRLRITADGVFGAVTARAVKTFQAGHKLVADGVVGPLTWAALGGFPCSAVGSQAVATVTGISSAVAARMRYSYRLGCPVPLSSLRYLRLPYWGWDGRYHVGELVVNSSIATVTAKTFTTLATQRFPIQQLRLVDDFKGDDDASVRANNTSAFNCRKITNGSTWSQHAYGRAIDVNPWVNPYIFHGRPQFDTFTHVARTAGKGKILRGDATYRAFIASRFSWGGDWKNGVLDYQHFEHA